MVLRWSDVGRKVERKFEHIYIGGWRGSLSARSSLGTGYLKSKYKSKKKIVCLELWCGTAGRPAPSPMATTWVGARLVG